MQKIGEDVTTELDYVPAVIVAREYVRSKYVCRKCQDGVLQEELPKRPIKKGFPGVGLALASFSDEELGRIGRLDAESTSSTG